MPAPEPVNLKEKVRHLPDKPGVYLMKDRLGRIIYVGKAKSLKKRVSSYFQRGRARTVSQPKIRALIEMIADLDTIEVKSEPGPCSSRANSSSSGVRATTPISPTTNAFCSSASISAKNFPASASRA
jgi:hypothetical protein